jgi:hypothetical protein
LDEQTSVEKLGPSKGKNKSRGWPYKIGFGRRIILRRIAGFALFASKLKKQRLTYSHNVGIPRDFGA